MAIRTVMMDIFQARHAVDAGGAQPEAEQAAKEAGAGDAWPVHVLSTGESVVAAVEASGVHGHVQVGVDHFSCVLTSESRLVSVSVVRVMMVAMT